MPFTWDRALNFAASLSSCNGQLVRSLEGIVALVSKIGEIAQAPSSLPFQLRGYTKTFSLYYSILASCPHLLHVELIFNSSSHLKKLKALEASNSTRKTVKFTNPIPVPDYHLTDQLVHAALRHEMLQNIENLHLENLVFKSPGLLSTEPLTPIPLSTCHIKSRYIAFEQARAFLPQDISNLRNLHLEIGLFKDEAKLSRLLRYLPSTMQHIEIILNLGPVRAQPTLSEYEEIDKPPFPSELFSRFSNLRNLTLTGHYLTPQLLEVLSTASPHLAHLNLFESRWVASDLSTTIRYPSYISGILDPAQATSLLNTFKRLETVHLGFLPTIGRGRYASLEGEMRRKGIDLDWEECEDARYCGFCGYVH